MREKEVFQPGKMRLAGYSMSPASQRGNFQASRFNLLPSASARRHEVISPSAPSASLSRTPQLLRKPSEQDHAAGRGSTARQDLLLHQAVSLLQAGICFTQGMIPTMAAGPQIPAPTNRHPVIYPLVGCLTCLPLLPSLTHAAGAEIQRS